MEPDPIMAEVRAAREELAKRAGYDMHRLVEMLMESQQRRKRKVQCVADERAMYEMEEK